jgi:hypothetical protein
VILSLWVEEISVDEEFWELVPVYTDLRSHGNAYSGIGRDGTREGEGYM